MTAYLLYLKYTTRLKMNIISNALSWVRSLEARHTARRESVPEEFREDFILTGYRLTNQPWRYYIGSLFQIHNETLNVWTHLIGMFVIWYAVGQYMIIYEWRTDKDSWPILIFGLCCSLTHFFSSLAHLLHSKSIYIHHIVFMADFIGVVMFAFGSGIMSMYSCSDKDFYSYFSNFYLPFLGILTWLNHIVFCYALLCFTGGPRTVERRCMQLAMLLTEIVVAFSPLVNRYHKCFINPVCSLHSFNHLTIGLPIFGVLVFFFLSKIPERFYPGKFDIVGHSHQIFHVSATIGHLLQMRGVHKDIQDGVPSHTEPDLGKTLLTVIIVLCSCVINICFMQKYIPCSLEKNKTQKGS